MATQKDMWSMEQLVWRPRTKTCDVLSYTVQYGEKTLEILLGTLFSPSRLTPLWGLFCILYQESFPEKIQGSNFQIVISQCRKYKVVSNEGHRVCFEIFYYLFICFIYLLI